MTEQELVQAIRDYIKIIYNAEYNGILLVTKSNSIYEMSIGIPSYMHPTTLSGDFETDEEFLDFIFKELKIRNYMRVYFYKVVRLKTTDDIPTPSIPVNNLPEITTY